MADPNQQTETVETTQTSAAPTPETSQDATVQPTSDGAAATATAAETATPADPNADPSTTSSTTPAAAPTPEQQEEYDNLVISNQLRDEGNNLFKRGAYRDALMAFSKAAEVVPYKELHIIHSNMSACHCQLKEYRKAYAEADKALKINPDWPKGISRMAAALHGLGKYQESMDAYKKVLELDNENEFAKQQLKLVWKEMQIRERTKSVQEKLKDKGNALYNKSQYKEAIECFTEAMREAPIDLIAILLSNRSACYTKLQLYNEALNDANKSIAMKPDWEKGYIRKGAALHAMKRYNDARRCYEEALEMRLDDDDMIRKALMNLESEQYSEACNNWLKKGLDQEEFDMRWEHRYNDEDFYYLGNFEDERTNKRYRDYSDESQFERYKRTEFSKLFI